MNKRALYGSITVIVLILGAAALCGFGVWHINQQSLLPNGGQFNAWIIGATIENPYSSGKVVVRSDERGNGYIDLQRSNWWNDESIPYNPHPLGGTVPDLIDDYYENGMSRTNPNEDFAWLTGPVKTFKDWPWHYWSATQGAKLDPDAANSGVPNLGFNIANMYPSNSKGEKDDSYGHVMVPKTFEDEKGNQRNYEIHIGYLVVEIVFSISSDYFENPEGSGNVWDGVAFCTSEAGGSWQRFTKLVPTYGAKLDFSATFRLDLVGLEIDGFYLNPSWLNGGNGVMELKTMGLGPIVDAETGITYNTVLSQNTHTWSYEGSNNIEEQANTQLNRYETAQDALDKNNPLSAEDVQDVNFKQQTPDKIYWNLDYTIELGSDYSNTNWMGTTIEDTRALQSIDFNQRVLVKFYTSQCEPLGPDGNDPLTITREPDEDKDDDGPSYDFFDKVIQALKNIWHTIVNNWFGGRQWLAILTAAGIALAILLIVAGVFGGPGAVVLILKILFFPFTALFHLVKAVISRRGAMA